MNASDLVFVLLNRVNG